MFPMMWWAPGFPWVVPVLLLLGVGVLVAVLAANRGPARPAPPESAEDLLRRRYAAGEIDAEEYRERLATLHATSGSAP